jgi:hypothetical protein
VRPEIRSFVSFVADPHGSPSLLNVVRERSGRLGREPRLEAGHLVYETCMGDVDFDRPTTVVIAGKPRSAIVHVDHRVEAAWRSYDRSVSGKVSARRGPEP